MSGIVRSNRLEFRPATPRIMPLWRIRPDSQHQGAKINRQFHEMDHIRTFRST
jgi:hypothetical protein